MENIKYLIVPFVILFFDQIYATRLIAQEECRRLLHVDAEPNSYFVNQGCLVKCWVHGNWRDAFEESERTCPGNPTGKCYKSNCRSNVKPQLGHIDVWFDRGEFPVLASYYVVACIRNTSESFVHPIPNVNRDCTVHCESNAIKGRNPAWKQVCANSGSNLFTNYSRVAFDVWNYTIEPSPVYDQFVGGADFLISDLFPNGTSGRAYFSIEFSSEQRLFVNVSFTTPSGATGLQLTYLFITVITMINFTMIK